MAYSQRPFLSKDIKKNLLSLYVGDNFTNENESEHSKSQTTFQTIKVYLRLKPFPKKLKLTEEQQEAYKITNSTTLLTKLPMLNNNGNFKPSKSNEIVCQKFTFSQTFGPEITQSELFEKTVQQQIIDFLAGQNCTIMTYGTTNSGKSYTLQGTTTSPGLISHALEFVFNNITTKPSPFYKPLNYSDVVNLNVFERAQELEAKTKLLTLSSVDQYMNTYKQIQKLLLKESIRPSQCHDAHYSVWVSFAEIYNEIVYDLLSSECQKERIPLKFGADSKGRVFIRGLKTIYVNSAAEAYQIFMAGQYNLKVAATALNAKSSRSHCIFTIILLKYYAENLPDTVEMSTFSFCDLAGSECLKTTLNIGDRLKEAQNIKISLLILGRCLKSTYDRQLTRTKTVDAVGPFIESKLTRLFQRSLSGKEPLTLIINVNPLPNFYEETQNVLNFAAVAKKIVIKIKKQIQKKLKSRFSQIVTQNIKTVTDWNTTELESVDWQPTNSVEENNSEYVTLKEYMDLASKNEKLRKKISLLKNSALIPDFESRQEMAGKHIAMINELEIDWTQRINNVETQYENALKWTVKQVEEFYKGKLNELHRKRKRCSDCNDDREEDDDNLNLTTKELVKENTQLKEKNETLKKTLTELKITNETSVVEKNKATFELGLKEDLKVPRYLLETAEKDIYCTQSGKVSIKKMTSQLLKDEQIKKLKEILNKAKEEYITITFDLKKNELCIDEQSKIIVENKKKIEDLELHLEHVNVCLTEKARIVELLEEKLEHQNENKILQLQEINKLKNEKLALIKLYGKELTLKTSIYNEYQEIIVNEELIIDEISKDSSKITENMKEKIENAKISINEIKEIDSNNLNPPTENVFPKQIVDTGCQVDITNDEDYDIKNKLEKSTQVTVTISTSEDTQTSNKMSVLKEEAVQTDDIANDDEKLLLNVLTTQLNDIQVQYKHKCSHVEELTEQLNDMKKTVHTLKEENHLNKTIVNEYKNSAEVLEKQLTLTAEEKQKIEETLLSSRQKIADYECKINQMEKNLSIAKDNAQQYLEKLETTKIELNNYTLKCKQETEIDVCESDNVSVKKKENYINDINVNQLDKYAEKISQLENSLETTEKLKHNIDQLNKNLKTCQVEKNCIQKALNENNEKLLELENRLKETTLKEQEKDTEIITLQKELKRMIQKSENVERTDDMMKTELKSTINELTQTKEMLLQKEQHIKELKIRLENSEKMFNLLLEQNAKERQVENKRLQNINDELRTNLIQKEYEMDAFIKNRDEMVTKYEALVKNQQEELNMQKREVMRYQELFFRHANKPIPNKDDYKKLQSRIEVLQARLQKYEAKAKNDYDSTLEEEVLAQHQQRGKKTVLSAKQENISVIEMSKSESKRNTRQATLLPPETSTEKRSTHKKKLFNENDSSADVKPAATILPTRNLRNRKK